VILLKERSQIIPTYWVGFRHAVVFSERRVFVHLLVHLSFALPFTPGEICQELKIRSGHGYSSSSGVL